jgi:hypothetical protein
MILGDFKVFSCAQFLVVYRYLGTFGVHKKFLIFEEFLVAFKVIMFYFELFSMIFPMFKNNGF